MTLKKAAQTALDCQDACNLSGVLASFKEIVHEVLWPEARRLGKGTEYVNQHPIVTLFLDKLVDLNGRQEVWSGEGNAHDQVKAIAAGEVDLKAHPAVELGGFSEHEPNPFLEKAHPEICDWCGAEEPHVCEERV